MTKCLGLLLCLVVGVAGCGEKSNETEIKFVKMIPRYVSFTGYLVDGRKIVVYSDMLQKKIDSVEITADPNMDGEDHGKAFLL